MTLHRSGGRTTQNTRHEDLIFQLRRDETEPSNANSNVYETIEERRTDPHIYLNTAPAVATTDCSTINIGKAKTNIEVSRKAVCLAILGVFLLCAVVSTISGLVVYQFINAKSTTARANASEWLDYLTNIHRRLDRIEHNQQIMQEKHNSSVQQVAFTACSPNGTLVDRCPTFTTIVTNIGAGYQVSTGWFHTPVSGLYLFSVTLLASHYRTENQQVYCWVVKNFANVAYVNTYEGRLDSASVSAFIDLSVGDRVSLKCGGWDYIYRDSATSFTGALINPD